MRREIIKSRNSYRILTLEEVADRQNLIDAAACCCHKLKKYMNDLGVWERT